MNDHCPGRGNPTREQNPAYGLLQPILQRTKQVYVDDQQLWNVGTVRLKVLLAELPGAAALQLREQFTRYRQTKESYAAAVATVDAAAVCRECEGQCCLNGKYRINVLDALARVAAEIPTTADFSQKPLCPYGTTAGCTMEPGLRPADCVLFICDAIEQKLSPQAQLTLAVQERGLRECITAASRLIGEQLGTPLLLWAAKTDINPN